MAFVAPIRSRVTSSSVSLLSAARTRPLLVSNNDALCRLRHASRQRQDIQRRLFSLLAADNPFRVHSTGQGPVHMPTRLQSTKAEQQDEASTKKKKKNRKKKSQKQTTAGKVFRADRVLSNRGWGSRSECFDILKQRRVYERIENEDYVEIENDDETSDDDEEDSRYVMRKLIGPSEKISMDADLWIDGKTEVDKPPPLLRVYHKPKWVLSVMNDNKGRPNLSDLPDEINKNMHPVGRLDYDTSGLLLFSSDGKLTQTLLHPNHEISKEYVAVVVGNVVQDDLRDVLAKGVTTSMGDFPAVLLDVQPIPEDEVPKTIDNIVKNLPPEYDIEKLDEKGFLDFKDAKELSQVRLMVKEGKHRMVRRILANSGFPVIVLKRERMGAVELGDLKEGSFRDLSEKEEQWAKSLIKNKKGKK